MNMQTILIVFFVLAGAGIVVAALFRKESEQQARNISVITGGSLAAGGGTGDENKDKQLAKQRADIAKKLKEASKEDADKNKEGSIKQLLIEAGFIETKPLRFWMYSAAFAMGIWLLLNFVASWPPIAVIFVTIASFLGLPKFFLKWKAARRQKKFLEEFPDALDASVRLLQAGMPVSEAIAMASREFTGQLKEEMTRIYENQKIGVPLGQAALETAHRVPLTEVYMFATALQIQSETGSSLSEVLSNLSTIIRARFRLKRKVKALSSEAKASAAIIASLPLLVTLGLKFANPEYISLLYTTPKGKFLATCAIGWMSCGVLIMRQMINFKI